MSFSSTLSSYLPQHDGILPIWLLLVSIISAGNSVQSYLIMSYTRRVYLGALPPPSASDSTSSESAKSSKASAIKYGLLSPATPLSSRTFGTWTFIASVVRFYAAYNISNPQIYQLALWTYVVAFWHFMSEWLIFGTARWSKGFAPTVIIATVSLGWMLTQWGFYVQ